MCSYMSREHYHVFIWWFLKIFLKLIGLLWNFKTASLLTPSLIPENFNSIGSVVFEISYVKILKIRKILKNIFPYT